MTKNVLKLVKEDGVALTLKKSPFRTSRFDYLGDTIRPTQLMINQHTADAVSKLKVPTTVL